MSRNKLSRVVLISELDMVNDGVCNDDLYDAWVCDDCYDDSIHECIDEKCIRSEDDACFICGFNEEFEDVIV